MKKIQILLVLAAAGLMASLSACTNVQNAPNMGDYSYVPPTQTLTVLTAPGIESY